MGGVRILISTWPAHGHLLPLLPIAHAAERAGHDVVVASGVEGTVEAGRRGLRTWEVGPSRAEANAAFGAVIGDLSAVAPERRMTTVVEGIFGAAAFRRAEALVPLVEEWQPDLVVHPITELAAAVAAERCGARHAVHGLGPLPREAWDWFGTRFADLCTTWDVPDLATGILERPYLDDCPPSLQPDAVAAFRNRRRMRATPGEAAPGEHLPWSHDDLAGLPFEQTVHLTLGTMFHGATEVFQTALDGLTRLEVNVLVTVGPDTDPARLGPQPPQVLVADFVAHELLLPHCDTLVTQGGAGTIVAALCTGLPHLILPQGADQFVNGATAEAAGVALVIPPPALTADGVTDAVRRLLEDSSFGAAARRVQDEIGRLPTADDVLAALLADAAPTR